jgi:hypothetical protein
MADRLRIMLSSRVDDPASSLPDRTTLRELRDHLKQRIEAVTLPGADERLFDVFVNEGEAALAGDGDVERHCREQIQRADIVLVLYNGSAGWASHGLEGICHLELRAAMDSAPHKVRIIRLPLTAQPSAADLKFRAYAESQHPFATDKAYDTTAAIAEQCHKALRTAIVTMVAERAREGSLRAARSRGDAFSWARLSMTERASEMRRAASGALVDARAGELVPEDDTLVALPWGVASILLRVGAVPGSMSTAAARERVGQPFLRDHELAPHLTPGRAGPVHLVVVQGGASETQAAKQLGSPDATIVPTDFGVYVADEVQKVQMIFLARCIDASAIFGRVQSLLNWLDATQEGDRLAQRAADRARVVALLAEIAG